MTKLVSAKCPNCGAALELSNEEEKVMCEYCRHTIIVDEAIATYKLKVSGNVSIDGVTTNAELIEAANELLDMKEYLKAKRKFLEFSEKCPDNYQGWLGLLICRTRNFTIKDNNVMFENDVNKYYEHFQRVAPEDVKKDYKQIMDKYFGRGEFAEKVEEAAESLQNKIKLPEINFDYKKYIAAAIVILVGLSFFSNSVYVGGLLWILAGVVLIPQVQDKIKISKKKARTIAIVLAVVGFCAFCIEIPASYEGQWESSDNNYKVVLSDGTFELERDGSSISGEYSHELENGQYTITLLSSDDEKIVFVYDSSSGQLCLYENNACSMYFAEVD